MNTKDDFLKISEELLDKLMDISSPHLYSTQSDLFYEGQTPIVAYLLVEGYIHLSKNKKVKEVLVSGTLLGLKELMNNESVDVDAQILPNTKVHFLDRSTVLEVLNTEKKDSKLQEFFTQVLTA